jgi:PAS domain S-box-containing protein
MKRPAPSRKKRSILDTHLARLVRHQPASLAALAKSLRELPVAALLANDAGSYVAANTAASRLMGYSVNELLSMSVWDLTPAVKEREIDVLWRSFVTVGTQRGTITLKTKKGTVVAARYVARSHILPGLHVSLLRRAV